MANYRLKLILISLLISCGFVSDAQFMDSIRVLKPIQISGSKEKFIVGSKIESIDSIKLSVNSDGSLTELINNYTPIYIKENAGGLATIRFRGTSADHTAIMFNGININSLTLGHSNISHIPTFLFDEVKVQYGSSSSLYGTDAIGGSIHLNNKTSWNRGIILGLEATIASFNSFFKGVKLGYSNNRLSYKLKGYHLYNKNNFPFKNIAVKDFEKNEYVIDTSKNSSLKNYGILQELDIRLSKNMFSYIKYWYDYDWYEAQPNMSSNYYGGDFVELENQHNRFISGVKYYHSNHEIISEFGYTSDYQLYNKIGEQRISTKTFIAKLNYYNNSFINGLLNIGFNYNFIIPKVYAYQNIENESRIDVFSSYKKDIFRKLKAIINLRETIVLNYKNHFSPSIGLDYTIFDKQKEELRIKLSYSSSYKIPTFNQRFWYPNGNPDILPEKGDNFELNTTYSKVLNDLRYDFGFSIYYMDVDDWIQWVNLGIWRPVNVKKVNNTGLEVKINSTYNFGEISMQTGINYSFTRAVEVASYINKNKIGKQLIYTPKHIGKIFVSIKQKSWLFTTNTSFVGKRYTENYKQLDGYLLFNVRIGKNIKAGSHLFNLNFKINNLFNKSYQNWEYYAMPGRNYAINLKYFINRLNN